MDTLHLGFFPSIKIKSDVVTGNEPLIYLVARALQNMAVQSLPKYPIYIHAYRISSASVQKNNIMHRK